MDLKDYLQFITVIILFFVILWAAYFATKFLGNLQMNKSNGSNLKIIEVIPVGPQKTLQLIRIGSEYMVIGVSKDHITFIQSVEESKLTFSEDHKVPFSAYMKKFASKHHDSNNKIGEDIDESKQ
ncbi:Flagellar protein [Petrocella atlantisensis]|uniref:Flagellar protein n=1 Tax=Petrocella atlantisensis TaxID=2173034 RepID=A0A3P7S052_9FIRM|nr:flagellar biosynthetic protein FliO [Petrocella atlantisensis]MCF8018479.1 flagellar biosynthetic protein FliO [Vallitaleaceae bacterium]VDN46309.1 Flagellar protein [Petrocella atlantisensis]